MLVGNYENKCFTRKKKLNNFDFLEKFEIFIKYIILRLLFVNNYQLESGIDALTRPKYASKNVIKTFKICKNVR